MLKLRNMYKKHEEVLNYLIVGGTTTIVSILSYMLLREVVNNYIINTILSWITAVLYAYITNRLFVFKSKNKKVISEISKFFTCRLLTLGIEIVVMFALVDLIRMNDALAKTLVQFIVLTSNYLFSKIFVFKRPK